MSKYIMKEVVACASCPFHCMDYKTMVVRLACHHPKLLYKFGKETKVVGFDSKYARLKLIPGWCPLPETYAETVLAGAING